MNWKDYDLRDWKRFQIDDSIELDDMKVIMLDIDRTVNPPREGRRNLIAIDTNEEILWIAELPPDDIFGSYHTIKIIDGDLYGWSNSLMCKISLDSGKILSERFVK